ncbi:MAG TPA: methyltransferase domain-containing protein [Baekduia sp.]|uniref:methyltransferase domain-containing protein n=1 Tax=Baekduia sp. TaxID=2600305 RepID=UPI002CC86B40|nr:methyltransferase domain-containing protein [Baekduia sp.]HMJ36410.1 methyltransferase domain-containing protein [Baekduia sp.]
MPTWEARVSRGTAPADRVDAELRYAFAAPLVRDAALWIDLGCGTGVPAGAALAGRPLAGRAILVDREPDALDKAARETGAEVAAAVEADLSTAEGAAAVPAAIAGAGIDGPRVVTCFDVLHQLADFTALVDLLLALGEDGATVLLSVPDDAAGGLDDPHRESAWSAGAAEELRRLLPPGAVSFSQVPVRAAAIVPAAGGESAPLGGVTVAAGQPPSHHLLAFGPDAGRLAGASLARAADLDAERADARRRESDLAYLEARLARVEAPAAG